VPMLLDRARTNAEGNYADLASAADFIRREIGTDATKISSAIA